MSDFIMEREKYVDELIDKITDKMIEVNRSKKKCIEMKLEEINLALWQQQNLRQTYRVIEQELTILEEVMTDHRVRIEQELESGEADESNWEAVEERERRLEEIGTALRNELAKSEEESNKLVAAREEEARVMEANKELVGRMEQERDRLMEVLEQHESRRDE